MDHCNHLHAMAPLSNTATAPGSRNTPGHTQAIRRRPRHPCARARRDPRARNDHDRLPSDRRDARRVLDQRHDDVPRCHVVAVILFFIVPLLRSDRSTPGQITTWLANSSVDSGESATRLQATIRFGVRWLPIAVGAFIEPLAFLAAMALSETLTMLVRTDRRSLSDVLARTMTVTRRNLEQLEDEVWTE